MSESYRNNPSAPDRTSCQKLEYNQTTTQNVFSPNVNRS